MRIKEYTQSGLETLVILLTLTPLLIGHSSLPILVLYGAFVLAYTLLHKQYTLSVIYILIPTLAWLTRTYLETPLPPALEIALVIFGITAIISLPAILLYSKRF